MSSSMVLSDVGVTSWYISHPPELPFLGPLWHMGTISIRWPLGIYDYGYLWTGSVESCCRGDGRLPSVKRISWLSPSMPLVELWEYDRVLSHRLYVLIHVSRNCMTILKAWQWAPGGGCGWCGADNPSGVFPSNLYLGWIMPIILENDGVKDFWRGNFWWARVGLIAWGCRTCAGHDDAST